MEITVNRKEVNIILPFREMFHYAFLHIYTFFFVVLRDQYQVCISLVWVEPQFGTQISDLLP